MIYSKRGAVLSQLHVRLNDQYWPTSKSHFFVENHKENTICHGVLLMLKN